MGYNQHMKIYDAVEVIIRKSIENGDPDRLSIKGKSLDLSEWKRTPEHLRMTYSILKNAGIEPQEVDLKRQISVLKEEIKTMDKSKDREARQDLLDKLRQALVTHNIKMESLRKR
ncbi:MAG TPA: DUF1992 domain-containing protein [Gammaproteobacteria bacterium]|nr:DUF1992 domain-containing protein [Gammaproteobacteria bacterium]HIL94556.1 DUF1992 domain-containing protein [Pseudomonadales bacterium]